MKTRLGSSLIAAILAATSVGAHAEAGRLPTRQMLPAMEEIVVTGSRPDTKTEDLSDRSIDSKVDREKVNLEIEILVELAAIEIVPTLSI